MKAMKLLICVFSIFNLLLTSCNTTEPESSYYRNKILFTSRVGGDNEQLYVIDPDGTNRKQITHGEFSHSSGRWSPDSKHIICNTSESYDYWKGDQMVIINYDGSDRRILTYGLDMCWSPDGNKILFLNSAGRGIVLQKIYLHGINIDGSNSHIISDKYTSSRSLSPDGSKMVTTLRQDTIVKLAIVNFPDLDSSVSIGPAESYFASWSPVNNEIVFSHRDQRSRSLSDIYIINADGTNLKRVTNNALTLNNFYPRWSPDGNRIIFLGYSVDGTAKSYLYMVNKDGTNLHRIVDDEYVTSCDWSR